MILRKGNLIEVITREPCIRAYKQNGWEEVHEEPSVKPEKKASRKKASADSAEAK